MSSTLPAPHKGELSRAARSRLLEKPPSALSDRNRALDQAPVEVALDEPFAEVHQTPFGERRLLGPRQSRTNCQRRSITIASIASWSETPV